MSDRDVGQIYPVAKAVITPVFKFAWRFHVEGLENVPAEGPAILCPNHTSVLDSFFIPAVLPRRITYVGKAEYMDDWKTKHLFPAMGMIPIDRTGGNASERALAAAQRILEAGELFGIYPEGTRSRDGVLHRGHTGPARLALRTGAPLIPVGLRGSRDIMPPEARFPKVFRPVGITFGKPIEVDHYADRADDRLVLRQIIDEVMYEIRELSGQEYRDEYATSKKKPEAEAPAPTVDVREPAKAEAERRPALVTVGAAPEAGAEEPKHGWHPSHEEPDEPAAALRGRHLRVVKDYDGLANATAPRSSAEVLARPVRRKAASEGSPDDR